MNKAVNSGYEAWDQHASVSSCSPVALEPKTYPVAIKTEAFITSESQETDSDLNPYWYEVKMEREDSSTMPEQYETGLDNSKQEFEESDTIGFNKKEENEGSQTGSDNNEESNIREYDIKVYSYDKFANGIPETDFMPRMLKSYIMNPANRRSRKGNGNSKEDPPRLTYKRKRSANFSADEKMRFLCLLRDKGKVIISKATAHDMKTNKMKEQAWDTICRNLNSNGRVMRSTDTLKKLWQKLKSDVKTKTAGLQARGTGSTKLDNSVLELVIEMTGSGNNGIIAVPDCDSDHQLPDTKNDDSNFGCKLSPSQRSSPPSAAQGLVCEQFLHTTNDDSLDENSQTVEEVAELPNCVAQNEMSLNNGKLTNPQAKPTVDVPAASVHNSLPQTKHKDAFNKTCDPEAAEGSNSCTERLRSESSKLDLIEHKIEQDAEFHQLRMHHERQLFLLKEQILKKVLQRIEDGDNLGPGVIELALSTGGK